MPHIALMVYAVAALVASDDRVLCFTPEPPTAATTRETVQDADVIVRARATEYVPAGFPAPGNLRVIRFTVLETIKGHFTGDHLDVSGSLSDEDDFNRGTVPYVWLRLSGQRGSCYATEYRSGAEYLFLLRAAPARSGFAVPSHGLHPYWKGLRPTNEQIRGPQDPWVQWVRTEVAAMRPTK
ncbi:hypothetical protein BH23GEM9_BH23GEM9_28550 [soil metagenome]